MKNLVILICLLFSFNLYSQKIDSIAILNQNTPPEIHVFGKLYHTGYSINDISYEFSDSLSLTLFFKECNGYQMVVSFDTIFSTNQSWPTAPNQINIISILDTNMTDTNCVIVNQYDTLEKNTFINLIFDVENLLQLEKINIYPNPTSKDVIIENYKNREYILTILNSTGQIIRQEHIGSNTQTIDLSELNTGVYFLRLNDQELIETIKIIKN